MAVKTTLIGNTITKTGITNKFTGSVRYDYIALIDDMGNEYFIGEEELLSILKPLDFDVEKKRTRNWLKIIH